MTPSASTTGHQLLVRKYGGSSLANVSRIRAVAKDIAATRKQGHQLVVVVSAMGTTTNELAEMARQASAHPCRRELDMLLSVGERITMSLLSMVLDDEGCPAISFTGSQCGIITDGSHTDARVLEVTAERVREALAKGLVVVVAGFQGVSREKEITTLGRGGSDTTAVALAAALEADRCEILKDVDGVLSADPKLVPEAWLHKELSYQEMLDIAQTGCGVVHLRAVEYAMGHQVPLQISSSFHHRPGTSIGPVRTEAPARKAFERENRYRPLVMATTREVTRLSLNITGKETIIRWREEILKRVDPCGVIAEWLDQRESALRWEILVQEAAVREIVGFLAESSEKIIQSREDHLACFSFSGGRPDSWLEVHKHLAEVLNKSGYQDWRLRADGPTLRLLVGGNPAEDLAPLLHRALLPA